MDTPSIWSNVQEKFAYILVLRGQEVHRLKVTGLMLKRKVAGVLEQLQQGADPREVGGKLETLDVRGIAKAQVDPGNGSLSLYREDGTSLAYSTANSDADAILAAILERAGRAFEPVQEEVGVVEAVLPPLFLGLIGGVFWFMIFNVASEHAAGHEVEVKGRRQGMKKLLIMVADVVGYNGAVAIGVLLAAWVLFSAYSRITKRPQRTVWLPASASASAPAVA